MPRRIDNLVARWVLRGRLARPALAALAFGLVPAFLVAAQQSSPPAPADAPMAQADTAPPVTSKPPKTPNEAFDRGLYDQALQGFVDQQVARPEDPELHLNIGSAHYKMRDYAAAERSFATAALSPDPALRGEALYNLGNTAFRQGQLEEAIARYQTALELNPEDEDSKFNLEFTRNEIRRRHEEAKKRQQENQQDGDQGEQGEQEQQGEDGQQGDNSDSPENQQENGDQDQDDGPDSDGDGLPDQTEREGENPTDPNNRDTDGDGLPDGQEDTNRNGRVDPEETDPNQQDTDGDGIPDAQDPDNSTPQDASSQGEGEPIPQGERPMTPEEAERYLQALEEGRPDNEKRGRGRKVRQRKDW